MKIPAKRTFSVNALKLFANMRNNSQNSYFLHFRSLIQFDSLFII